MSKLPEGITSVRLDKEIYERFKEFCNERGLLAPKQIGFLLEGMLQNKENFELIKSGWKLVETRKRDALLGADE